MYVVETVPRATPHIGTAVMIHQVKGDASWALTDCRQGRTSVTQYACGTGCARVSLVSLCFTTRQQEILN